MASTDRNKVGKATDIVCHLQWDNYSGVLCKNIRYGLRTDGTKAQGPVTCKNCIKLIALYNQTRDLIYHGKGKIKTQIA